MSSAKHIYSIADNHAQTVQVCIDRLHQLDFLERNFWSPNCLDCGRLPLPPRGGLRDGKSPALPRRELIATANLRRPPTFSGPRARNTPPNTASPAPTR